MSNSTKNTRHKHLGGNKRDDHPDFLDENIRKSKVNIDVTHEEFARIENAFKKEEFRKLFFDYCEEIQDPKNRQIYEDEIKQLEKERGVDVTFINPEPGFVIKTSVNGKRKCYLNIAICDKIDKPKSETCINPATGIRGLSWSIPLAQGQPRDDVDGDGNRCTVFDVIFHTDAIHLAKKCPSFRKCIVDTALDAVEREFKVNLDRNNLHYPKFQFKGISRPIVIRRLTKNPKPENIEPHPLEHIYPPRPSENIPEPTVLQGKSFDRNTKNNDKTAVVDDYTTPKYIIKYRRNVDLSEYTDELDSKLNVTIPRQLIVEIDLPMLKTTAECVLDVMPRTVYLLSDRKGGKYRLKLDLPYEVNEKNGNAFFDVGKRQLRITLPVVQQNSRKQRDMHDMLANLTREDSGVDCETNSNQSESPVEELNETFNEIGKEQEQKQEQKQKQEQNESLISVIPTTAKHETDVDISSPPLVTQPESQPELTAQTFYSSNIRYIFPPKFDCNVLDNAMSLVLHVRNVQPESICLLHMEECVFLKFTSIGSGYVPLHYGFYFQVPNVSNNTSATNIKIDSANAEAWENNVVLNLNLTTTIENLYSYFAGVDSSDVKEFIVQEKFQIVHHQRCGDGNSNSNIGVVVKNQNHQNSAKIHIPPPATLEVSVERSDCERSVEIEIKPRNLQQPTSCAANTTEDEGEYADGINNNNNNNNNNKQFIKKLSKKQKKKRDKKVRTHADDDNDFSRHQRKTIENYDTVERQSQQKRQEQNNNNDGLPQRPIGNKEPNILNQQAMPTTEELAKTIKSKVLVSEEAPKRDYNEDLSTTEEFHDAQGDDEMEEEVYKDARARDVSPAMKPIDYIDSSIHLPLMSPAHKPIQIPMKDKQRRQQQQQQRKQRSYSECHENAFSSSAGSGTISTSYKSILKRYSRYDRRLSMGDSMSSIDDLHSFSCSVDDDGNVGSGGGGGGGGNSSFSKSFDNIPEENSSPQSGLSESCKKTVRFSEHIKKQVFRYDSSILGQRKKNQKRRDRKERAIRRRVSEGDSAEYDDTNLPEEFLNPQNNKSKNFELKLPVKNIHQYNNNNINNNKIANNFNKQNKTRLRQESESSVDNDNHKNSLMFEMDDM